MIHSQLFRKHFAIAAGSVLGFVGLGSFLTVLVIQSISDKPAYQPPLFFARLVEHLSPGDAVQGVRLLESLHAGDRRPFDVILLDERGRVLSGVVHEEGGRPARPIPEIRPSELPREVHHGVVLKDDAPGGGRPPSVVRLNYDPPRYLLFLPGLRFGPPPPSRLFPATFTVLVVMVLVGVAFALFFIFRSLREHVETADHVLTELQRGNLKARFPTGRTDEIGRAMERFNRMADEIERLMEQLRSVERSRTFLLQELTHDLRTPVASLSNLLDTIFSNLDLDETRAELAGLAQKEAEYIGRLVEDLLLLAQVNEPSYRTQAGRVDILSLVEEEGEALALRSGGRVRFDWDYASADLLVAGDEHLLRRLVRNALENAFSFAASRVRARAARGDAGQLRLTVEDDGPGFSPEMLVGFGERRTQRKIDRSRAGRLSLGLGSVIMKTVAALHRGDVQARNGAAGGGVVEIRLPLGPT